jgi:predicted metal-dependent phosphoesterase TrpH
MKADLHVHSRASDGLLSPEDLVAQAIRSGVDVLALADHDTVEGCAKARAAARGTDLIFVDAVELSCTTPHGDIHLLAYFIDPADAAFCDYLSQLRDARYARAVSMVTALTDGGFPISLDAVLRHADGGSVGRSHVARALVDDGHATSIADAFHRLIGHDMPFYVPKRTSTPDEALRRIGEAGGFGVVAHPVISRCVDDIEGLAELGLRGVEAYHADQSREEAVSLEALSDRLGLLVTGGSDHHGPGTPSASLGAVDLPERHIRRFLAAGGTPGF